MTWLYGAKQIATYLSHGDEQPSAALVYRMVRDGLRVADTGRGKGCVILTCPEWIDDYLVAQAERREAERQPKAVTPGPHGVARSAA